MSRLQSVKRTAGGLVTNPNALSEVPQGALLEAENCVIDRPGVISKRRGFARFGTTISADALFEYRQRLLVFDKAASKLYYDASGIGLWTAYPGTIAPPDAAVRMRAIESQTTLYLTSLTGVKRTDTLAAAPVSAGIAAGLDTKLSLTGIGGGWFTPETQVGYRILWGRLDVTDRLLRGAPSFRETITNVKSAAALSWARSGAGPWTITVTHTAHGFATSDILEISDSTASTLNGQRVITVTGADTYTFSSTSDPGASGTLKDGKKYNVRVEFTLPDDVVEGDFYDLYRTDLSASATTDPGDRQKSVIRYTIPAASVTMAYSAGVVTVTHTAHGFATGDVIKIFSLSDALYEEGRHLITVTGSNAYTYTVAGAPPATGSAKVFRMHVAVTDDWDLTLGDELYTNPSQEGILKANTRPPWSKDMALYRGYMHYLNTRREHYIEFQLTDETGLVDNTSSITVTLGATTRTYTFSTAEDLANRKFQRVTTQPTSAQNIAETMKGFLRIVNRDPGSLWYGYYVSGINDSPGIIVLEARTISTTGFSVTCNNTTTSTKFAPNIPTSGVLFSSDDQAHPNGLYQAKLDEPEAVPDLDWDPIGDESREGLRILPTQDSLIIVTRGGVYRKSGKGDRGFTIEALDLTIQGRAPETWVPLDNGVFGLSTNGIVRVTETGTQLISWPIDDIITKLLSFPNYETITHAVGYESDSKYVLFCQEKSTDTKATVAWVYNTITRQWTGPWRKSVKSAKVLFEANKLYLGNDDSTFAYVLEERKSSADELADYADEEMDVTLSTVGTTTDPDGGTVSQVTLTGYAYALEPAVGWLFRKDPSALPWSKVIAVAMPIAGTWVLDLEGYFPGLSAGTAKVSVGIKQRVRWVPEAAENVGSMKHFPSVQIYLEKGTALRNHVGFSSDVDPTETFPGEVRFDTQAGGVMIREIVPQQFQKCRALSLFYESRYALEHADILHVAFDLRITGSITMARSR